MNRYASLVLCCLSVFTTAGATAVCAAEQPSGAELTEVRKIWDQGKHNAFTDLIRFKDRWFCVFREGEGHVSQEATIRVIASDDGRRWESALLIEMAGYDLRDAKICVTPDGKRLMVNGAATVREGRKPATLTQSFVTFSTDGTTWDKPQWVGRKDYWLWRVTWFGGKCYGVDYDCRPETRVGSKYNTGLLASDDGVHFTPIVPDLYDVSGPNEATLRFLSDGTCYNLQRRDGKPTNTALLGVSKPPYKEWKWDDLGVYFGGPNFIQLPNGRWIAGGRLMHVGDVKGPKTVICELDIAKPALVPLLVLPSGGDTSYPGLVWHDGLLWVSYYSSHEGKTSIYLAKLKLTAPK